VESIVQQPAALLSLDPAERAEAGIGDTLVRYALGVEAVEDIIEDLRQALEGVPAAAERVRPFARRPALDHPKKRGVGP
jgi:hypothetical protein